MGLEWDLVEEVDAEEASAFLAAARAGDARPMAPTYEGIGAPDDGA